MRPPKQVIRKPLVSPEFAPYLTSRGVPEGVIHSQFPHSWEMLVTRIDYAPDKYIAKSISVDKQVAFFNKTMERPFDGNYLFCISGETSDNIGLQLALQIFVAATQLSNDSRYTKPLWHTVFGYYKDELRDGDPESISLRIGGKPSLLIISNIAANSTAVKIEKVRDLLQRYSNVPRIIVVGGSNPITFCSSILHMSVNRILYFGFKPEDN